MDIIISSEKTAIVTGISKSAKILATNTNAKTNVLDYGCGKLRNSNFLSNEGFNVSILDTSKQISSLDINNLNKFKSVYELENIEVDNINKYNAILCSFVLNVIPNKEDRVIALNNIYNLLEENGIAYIEVRGKGFLKNAKSKMNFNDGYILGTGHIKTFQKGFSKDDLITLISESSLIIDKVITNGDSIIAVCKRRILC